MTIPDELQRSRPRNVTLSYQGWVGAITLFLYFAVLAVAVIWGKAPPIFFVPGFIVSLVAAALGVARIQRQRGLLMNGRATVATVAGDVTPWWFRFRKRGARRNRRLQCEFPLLSGGVCKTTVEVRSTHINGMEFVVVYDPDEPQTALKYPAHLLKIPGA